MIEVKNKNDLIKLKAMFLDIRFHMGLSVIDGKMGKAYVDNIEKPKFAMLIVRKYCFMNGIINLNELLKTINEYKLKEYILIPSNEIKAILEEHYKDKIIKYQRYSIKKDPKFDTVKLKKYIDNYTNEYEFKRINQEIANRINKEKFIIITDNYKKNGIGYCCLYNNQIIGVASSNIIYNDGIEVNIKVKEEFQRKHIATILAAKLILLCINNNKTISWDAANMKSVKLAEKLGFQYDSTYDVYKF